MKWKILQKQLYKKSIEKFGILSKGVSETVQNEVKEQKEDFLICYQAHQVQAYQEIFQLAKE